MSSGHSPCRRDDGGFTLLETLVAFVILALSLGTIVQAFGGSTRGARLAAAYALATQLAESKLAAIGVEAPLSAGEQSGAMEGGFAWTITVRPHVLDIGPVDLPGRLRPYEIAIRVRFGDRLVELETIRLAADGP